MLIRSVVYEWDLNTIGCIRVGCEYDRLYTSGMLIRSVVYELDVNAGVQSSYRSTTLQSRTSTVVIMDATLYEYLNLQRKL